MKIEITPLSIFIHEKIDKPTITQVDEIMAALTSTQGKQWEAVKLSGSWFIRCDAKVRANSPKFEKALANATNLNIVTLV